MDEWAGSLLAFFPLSKIKEEEENGAAVSTILYTHVERSCVTCRILYLGFWRGYPHSLPRPETGQGEICITAGCAAAAVCRGPAVPEQPRSSWIAVVCVPFSFLCGKKDFSKHFLIWRHQSSGCCGAVAFWYSAGCCCWTSNRRICRLYVTHLHRTINPARPLSRGSHLPTKSLKKGPKRRLLILSYFTSAQQLPVEENNDSKEEGKKRGEKKCDNNNK